MRAAEHNRRAIAIRLPIEAVEEFCQKWGIAQFALFGSVLSHNFRPDSDIDVLVTFQPRIQHGLFDVMQMEEELSQLFGRDVDLVTRRGVEMSHDSVLRDSILSDAEVIYAR